MMWHVVYCGVGGVIVVLVVLLWCWWCYCGVVDCDDGDKTITVLCDVTPCILVTSHEIIFYHGE
jgi:hypothetical protein